MKLDRLTIKKMLLVVTFIIFVAAFILLPRIQNTFNPSISDHFPTHAFTEDRVWRLDIAATTDSRTLGLGKRPNYPTGQGMLFLFPTNEPHGFWMKDMNFAIDIIFLRQGKVVSIERAFQPTDERIVIPTRPVDQVLEVNAGEAGDIVVGHRLWFWRGW